MRVLLTRPSADSDELAALLRKRGHEAIVSPVLEIRFPQGPELPLEGVSAILATSANGIRALAQRTRQRDLPVFAVGPQTSLAAKLEGFGNVRNAGGNAAALSQRIPQWAAPDSGVLLHATGGWSMESSLYTLQDQGYAVRTEVLYEAVERLALTPEAHDAVNSSNLNAVMLFSPRSAAIFAKQIQTAGLSGRCAHLTALCISEAAASALSPLLFRATRIAAHPDQDGMLALLD